ncbi:flagellar biosynthesis anti-sigma factor FlgM [Acidovorax sp. SRB_14]|uniref:flagellar biosynthesis anti-sigma factor FlgM n=1 Tax=Acidovorax sp. SRB_14 TaxID=1962699 RepID=UPI0015638D14|nr:flagellar biosynthesis anti-sigma factor FlgM [Acidovorax sp. SRB_14]NMM82228.1 flagellar biosynthesis anti-sigma factor FlgM [Acidovorax sp. SRB_14]
MKIGQTPELPSAAVQAGSAKQQGKAAAPAAPGLATGAAAAAATAGVPVSLSRAALAPTGRTAGDFDADRVKAVRAAIERGTFKVDAGAVADKMLANATEILSRARS